MDSQLGTVTIPSSSASFLLSPAAVSHHTLTPAVAVPSPVIDMITSYEPNEGLETGIYRDGESVTHNDIVRWSTSNYQYDEINDMILPQAETAKEWTEDEQLILAHINKFDMSKVRTDGHAKSLSMPALQKRYHYLARFRKLEDNSRQLFERTTKMIENKIDVLKRKKIWKS